MPRAFVTGEQALLESESYQVHLQLWVEDPDGVFVDYTALGGSNWLMGFEHREGIDQAVSQIVIELWREDVTGSLAPLMGGSPYNRDALDNYVPGIDVGREFYIRNAITAPGVAPTSGQWWELVRGEIDEIPHGDRKSRMQLICRDLGGVLQEIETSEEMEFGTAGDSPEEIMQLVLDQWYPSVTLYTPVATGQTRGPLTVAKGRKLLDVLREVALDSARDLRYVWDAGTSAFRLTFYLPDRDKTVPDITVGPSLYTNITHLGRSRKLVRNDFSIVYTDVSTGLRTTRTRTNATSIAKYGGPFWMGFEEPANSPIDTEAEADAYLEAADLDTSEPLADQEIEILYYPHFQLNDLVRFTANGVHYDSDQDWAVVGVRRRCYPNERRVWVQTRGKPVASVKGWLRKAIPPPPTGPAGPIGLGVAVREQVSETADEGTLTLVPITGAVFDTVEMQTQVGNAAWGSWGTISASGGNYVGTVDLVEKHASKIAYRVTDDSVVVQENVVTFDFADVADVIDVNITDNDAGAITFIVEGDADTAIGAAKGRWSYTDGAGAYTSFDVDASRRGGYTFFGVTDVNFWVYVQLQNSAGTWGPTRRVDIPAYLGGVERFHRIDASTFVTGNPDYDVTDEYVTSAGAFDATSWHGVDFPNTIELTKLRAHAYITDDTFGAGMDIVSVSLSRHPDSGAVFTALANVTNGGPGSPEGAWTTVEDTLSEVIGSSASSYRLGIHVGTGTPPNARLKWVEFGYLGSWR